MSPCRNLHQGLMSNVCWFRVQRFVLFWTLHCLVSLDQSSLWIGTQPRAECKQREADVRWRRSPGSDNKAESERRACVRVWEREWEKGGGHWLTFAHKQNSERSQIQGHACILANALTRTRTRTQTLIRKINNNLCLRIREALGDASRLKALTALVL